MVQGFEKYWSGKRDLNPRPSPWQGDALPLSYSRFCLSKSEAGFYRSCVKAVKLACAIVATPSQDVGSALSNRSTI